MPEIDRAWYSAATILKSQRQNGVILNNTFFVKKGLLLPPITPLDSTESHWLSGTLDRKIGPEMAEKLPLQSGQNRFFF